MAADGIDDFGCPHSISIVVPVYRGERTLPALIAEIAPLAGGFTTADGHRGAVGEVLLVHDNGPDDSSRVLRELPERHPFVRPVWLSRNFGQHAATLAGMASSGGDWIVTLDEDGQHDPAAIPDMLDTAMREGADVVYAKPTNQPPHGVLRNSASRSAKVLIKLFGGDSNANNFQSYRLMLGEVGRSVAAYAGAGVYLDVAVGWVARRVASCPVKLRTEGDRPSGYSFRSLVSHYWRMVLSGGTRALRLVSLLGIAFAIAGFVLAMYFLVAALFFDIAAPQGWASLMVALLVCSGASLFSLGVIAEYIGVAVNMAMGKPPYLIVSDPVRGPLGRASPSAAASAVRRHAAEPSAAEPAPAQPADARSGRPGSMLP